MSLAELMGQPAKHYMRMFFKIEGLEGKRLTTRFCGFLLSKEQIFRIVRKRTQKIEMIYTFETRDKWVIQATAIVVLNRKAEASVEKKMRHAVEAFLIEKAASMGIDDFMKLVINNVFQTGIKKMGNKIYPVRFSEIAKIEVIKVGPAISSQVTATAGQGAEEPADMPEMLPEANYNG